MKIKAQIDRMVGENNRIKSIRQCDPRRRICRAGHCSHGQQKRTVRPNAISQL